MRSTKQRRERNMEGLLKLKDGVSTYIPEKAKVMVGDELSAECCGNLLSKFKILHTPNGQTPDNRHCRTPEIPNPCPPTPPDTRNSHIPDALGAMTVTIPIVRKSTFGTPLPKRLMLWRLTGTGLGR